MEGPPGSSSGGGKKGNSHEHWRIRLGRDRLQPRGNEGDGAVLLLIVMMCISRLM